MRRRAEIAPASEHLLSEPAIVAGMAKATLGERTVVDWDGFVADYDLIRDAIEDVFPIFQAYNARIRIPGGFHLTSTARERIWMTPSGKANFLVFDGLGEDPRSGRSGSRCGSPRFAATISTTPRSTRCPTAIAAFTASATCSSSIEREMEKRGLQADDRVDLVTHSTDGIERVVRGFRVVPYAFPDGCCAAYYPETNPLVPLYSHDPTASRRPRRASRSAWCVPALRMPQATNRLHGPNRSKLGLLHNC